MNLQTERLLLRAFSDADLDAYAAMCADAEVMRYLSVTGALLSREDAWRQMALFAGHWALRGFGMWAVEERGSGRFIGRVGLHQPEGWPDRELGWSLAREAWGRGYATEAAMALVEHARTALAATRVVATVDPANAASRHVLEKVGMTADGERIAYGRPHAVYAVDAGGLSSTA